MKRADLYAGTGITTATKTQAKFSTGDELREVVGEIAATAPTTWIVVSRAVRPGQCVRVPPGADGREYLWMNPEGLARLKAENEALAPAARVQLNEAHSEASAAAWGVPVYQIDGKTSERATMIRRAYAKHTGRASL